jgi:hypothetical protein
MKILEIGEVQENLEKLSNEFERSLRNSAFIDNCLTNPATIDVWYYSKKQYFHPLPFENELSGFSRGALIKKIMQIL